MGLSPSRDDCSCLWLPSFDGRRGYAHSHAISSMVVEQGLYVERPIPYIDKSDQNVRPPTTWSSLLANLDRLSVFIGMAEGMIARPEFRRCLSLPIFEMQVSMLREELKSQQERFLALLRLIKEYADMFLSDLSEEIQQQSTLQDALEWRRDMAKHLREEVTRLRKSYEVGTLNRIERLRRMGLSEPLPQDAALFRDMDIITNDVRRCYVDMDEFWVDEVQRANKALKNRHVDTEDIERWNMFRESLEDAIADWETIPTENWIVAVRQHTSNTRLPAHDLRPIVSSLSDVVKTVHRGLGRIRFCATVGLEFVKSIHYSSILQAQVEFSENRMSCAEFLRGCIRYGTAVVMACTAFASYSPFSRTRNSQDLVDRATSLATDRIEVSAQPAIQMRGMRKFKSIHKKCVLSLRRMDHNLNSALSCISSWIAELEAHSTFPAFDMKRLQRLSRVWLKNREAIEHILASLPSSDQPSSHVPPLETRL